MATYHPPKLPGELAGKSSNTKWAVERTWDWLDLNAERDGIDQSRVVLTIADADTDFHDKFFEGLTYYFARLSDEERDLTIFQAPIMHYKNYHTQPSIVRLCSLFVSQVRYLNSFLVRL